MCSFLSKIKCVGLYPIETIKPEHFILKEFRMLTIWPETLVRRTLRSHRWSHPIPNRPVMIGVVLVSIFFRVFSESSYWWSGRTDDFCFRSDDFFRNRPTRRGSLDCWMVPMCSLPEENSSISAGTASPHCRLVCRRSPQQQNCCPARYFLPNRSFWQPDLVKPTKSYRDRNVSAIVK